MDATTEQIQGQALAIAAQAEAIASGGLHGPLHGATRRLLENARTLEVWARDTNEEG